MTNSKVSDWAPLVPRIERTLELLTRRTVSLTANQESFQKLARAEEHLETLWSQTKIFLASDPYSLRWQQLTPGGQFALMAQATKTCPKSFGILIGEIAHNARCALDYIAFRLSTLAPNDKGRLKVQFPIADIVGEFFNRKPLLLNGVDQSAVSIIESLQPYQTSGINTPLAMLRDLSNGDKHRAIRVVTARGKFHGISPSGVFGSNLFLGGEMRFGMIQGSQWAFGDGVTTEMTGSGDISETESEILRATLRPNTVPQINPLMSAQLQFATGQPGVEGLEVIQTMRLILDRVAAVIASFP